MQTIDFKQLKLNDHDKLLDVGCGEGRHTIGASLVANIESIGIDQSEKDLTTAKQRASEFSEQYTNLNIQFESGDALQLPYADASFDKVICSEVLEHIPDYRRVLIEINRVLKPDGILAISVPRAWPEEICWRLSKAYHEVEGGHIRIFNSLHLRHEVESLGWKKYAGHWAHALHSPYWWLKCWQWENSDSKLVNYYHRFLVWDLMKKPWITQTLEKLLNPLLGKSVVMYFSRSSN